MKRMDRVATGAARCFRMGGGSRFFYIVQAGRLVRVLSSHVTEHRRCIHFFPSSVRSFPPAISILLNFCRVQLRNNSNSAEALRNHQLFGSKQWVVSKLILFYLLEPFLGEGDFICSNHCSERGVWCRTGVWGCSLYGSSSHS